MHSARRLLAALTLALLGAGVLPAAAPAQAAPTSTRDVDELPSGRLATQTISLGPRPRAGGATIVDVDPGTQSVGVSWVGSDAAEVEVRGRRDGGPWGDWAHLHPDASGDTASGRVGAGPAWLDEAGVDQVELRLASGDVRDLRIDAMGFTATRSSRAAAADQPATAAGGPPIHTRGEWAPGGWQGWREGCTPNPMVMDRLRFAVVHHTVSSNTYSASAVPGLLASMYRFHTETNGWCDIAYSFFVDRFGRVWQGRSGDLHAPVMGGHAKGFNTHSVGVALLGQHHPGASPSAVHPTAAAMAGVRDVLAWKLGSHNVDPRATIPIVSQGSPRFPEGQRVHLPAIQGHRDSGLTSCPGELAHGRLAQLRADVASRIAATRSPSTWAPATTGPAFFGRIVNQAAGRPLPNGVPGRSTSRVVRGGAPRDGIAYEITFAAGTDARIGTVDRLYRAAFVRWPDGPGLRFWVGQRDAGRSTMGIARSFADSSEFRRRYDALDDRAFVDALYRNVLGRPADQAGSDHWTGRLAAGMPRYELLAHLSESGEHKVRTHRQTGISRAYYVLVVRAPSASDRTFWERELAAGRSGQDMVSALLRSSEYAAGQ